MFKCRPLDSGHGPIPQAGHSRHRHRYTNAVLTAAGYNHLVAAAPGHVATVRELVIDALDDTALSALQDSAERITARIDARHSAERRSAMSSISQQTAIDEPEGLDQH
jgi:hypothetical protein